MSFLPAKDASRIIARSLQVRNEASSSALTHSYNNAFLLSRRMARTTEGISFFDALSGTYDAWLLDVKDGSSSLTRTAFHGFERSGDVPDTASFGDFGVGAFVERVRARGRSTIPTSFICSIISRIVNSL